MCTWHRARTQLKRLFSVLAEKVIHGRDDFSPSLMTSSFTKSYNLQSKTDISWLVWGRVWCGGETRACGGNVRRSSSLLFWLCWPVSVSALWLPSAAPSRCCPAGLGLDSEKLKEQNYIRKKEKKRKLLSAKLCLIVLDVLNSVYIITDYSPWSTLDSWLHHNSAEVSENKLTHRRSTCWLKVNCCSGKSCGFPSLSG